MESENPPLSLKLSYLMCPDRLASVMNENFDTRRDIYGDAALGEANLQMINIARKHGSAVKFPGSGGAVIGLCLDESKQVCTEYSIYEHLCEIIQLP